MSSVDCPALQYFSALSHKQPQFSKKYIEQQMCVLNFSTILSEDFLILKTFQQDVFINVSRAPRKVPFILAIFQQGFHFINRFSKYCQI